MTFRQIAIASTLAIIAIALMFGSPKTSIELPLSDLTIESPTNNLVVQRASGETQGQVKVSGAAFGQAVAIEAQIRHRTDDRLVVDWVDLDANPSPDRYRGILTVPQGGPYYVVVRDKEQTGIVETSANDFFVGMIVIATGQSNMAGHFGTDNNAPSAPLARFLNPTTGRWQEFPPMPIRHFAHKLTNLIGLPVGVVKQTRAATGADEFAPGGEQFAELKDQLPNFVDAEFIIVHQGEEETNVPHTKEYWQARWSEAHEGIARIVGRTQAQIPMIFSSLASFGGRQEVTSDDEWWAIQEGIVELSARDQTKHYSHSNYDAQRVDAYHYDTGSYVRSAIRYAHTIAYLTEHRPSPINWSIEDVSIQTDATTIVKLVHGTGTDFSPNAGISGFEVSRDGEQWISAIGSRIDATTIELRHAVLPETDQRQRFVRYQFGTAPDLSVPVFDNSALQIPLNHSADQVLMDTVKDSEDYRPQ